MRQGRLSGSVASAVNDRIVIEMNGMVLKLPAQTAARRIAEIVFALEARR